jgi:polygalacturonase
MEIGKKFNVKLYGATGLGRQLDTAPIQKTIDDCYKAGGGTVEFPPGVYLTGNVLLRDNVTINLQPGTVIQGSDDLNDYQLNRSYLILGRKVRNAAIIGGGTINCNSRSFFRKRAIDKKNNIDKHDKKLYEAMVNYLGKRVVDNWGVEPWRPRVTLYLFKCEDILIRDVKFIESATTTISITGCVNVRLNGITVANEMDIGPSDVINIVASQNVFITDSYIASEDDPICIYHSLPCLDHVFTMDKSLHNGPICIVYNGFPCFKRMTTEEMNCMLENADQLTDEELMQCPTENVVVSNCILNTYQNAFRINGGKKGSIRNVSINNCIIPQAAIAFNIKNFTQFLFCKYPGNTEIENIFISNVSAQKIGIFPFIIRNEGPRGCEPGHIKNVHISNSSFECSTAWCAYISGNKEKYLENIKLTNVEINVAKNPNGEWQDEVPYPNLATYEMDPVTEARIGAGYKIPPYTIYCRNVDKLHLHDVTIKGAEEIKKGYSALCCKCVKNLKIEFLDVTGFCSKAKEKTVAVFDNVQNAVIQGCTKISGAKTLLQKGKNKNITIS